MDNIKEKIRRINYLVNDMIINHTFPQYTSLSEYIGSPADMARKPVEARESIEQVDTVGSKE
jgi:hypothetical protein